MSATPDKMQKVMTFADRSFVHRKVQLDFTHVLGIMHRTEFVALPVNRNFNASHITHLR